MISAAGTTFPDVFIHTRKHIQKHKSTPLTPIPFVFYFFLLLFYNAYLSEVYVSMRMNIDLMVPNFELVNNCSDNVNVFYNNVIVKWGINSHYYRVNYQYS